MRNIAQNREHLLSVRTVRNCLNKLVGRGGIEPPTRGLKDRKTIVSKYADFVTSIDPELFLILGTLVFLTALIRVFLYYIGNT
jgi:hypothetical protein